MVSKEDKNHFRYLPERLSQKRHLQTTCLLKIKLCMIVPWKKFLGQQYIPLPYYSYMFCSDLLERVGPCFSVKNMLMSLSGTQIWCIRNFYPLTLGSKKRNTYMKSLAVLEADSNVDITYMKNELRIERHDCSRTKLIIRALKCYNAQRQRLKIHGCSAFG